jgi:hypothetical protein
MRKITAILMFVFFGVVPVDASILMRPYLQAVSADGIYVLTECDGQSMVTVDFGGTTGYGRSANDEAVFSTSNNTFVHRVRLAGLDPDSAYHYRVSQGNSPASDDGTFRTSVKKGTAFSFAFMADCGSNTQVHDEIAKLILGARPAFSIYGGGICSGPSYDAFKNEFFTKDELALDGQVPFYLSPGNPEGWGRNTMAFTRSPQSASDSQAYYSFDQGDLHVLVLNTELPCAPDSAQYAFAAADLAANDNIWKIVVCHKPAYCSGGRGEDKDLIGLCGAVFESNRVCAVISGDSHFYQHNIVNGIHHLIMGDAGAPQEKPASAPYTVNSAQKYNYGVGEVSAETFVMNVYDEKGGLIEAVNIKKPAAKAKPKKTFGKKKNKTK